MIPAHFAVFVDNYDSNCPQMQQNVSGKSLWPTYEKNVAKVLAE